MLTIQRQIQLTDVYDTMACAAWIRDVEGRLILMNRTARELLDPGSRMSGPPFSIRSQGWRACDENGTPLSNADFPSAVAIRTGQPQRHKTIGFHNEDDVFLWLLVDAVPLADEHGVVRQAVSTAVDITELKRTESALRVSEERYRRIVETTHEGVCLIGLDSRITYVNTRLCQMLGYRIEDIVGRSTFDLIEESSAGLNAGTLRAALRNGGHSDFALRHKDGTTVWTTVSGAPMIDDTARPSAVLAMFTDITERKLSEDAMRRGEARFRALIENSSDVIAITDRAGRLTYVSPAAARLSGHQADGGCRDVFDHVHPDDLAAVQSAFRAVLESPGSRRHMEARVQDAAGGWHFCKGIATNLLHDPAVSGVVFNVRDITDRKQAQERATAAAKLIERLTADAIIVADADGRAVSWNEGAERLLGWTKDEVLGRPLPYVPPEGRATRKGRSDQIRRSGDTLTKESIAVSRTGERIPVLGSWSPVPLEGGEVGILAIFKDLRPHEAAHRKLTEQAEALSLLRERERIAMDLHDGVIQSLYGVTLGLGALRRQVDRQAEPGARLGVQASLALTEAIGGLTASIEHIRECIFDLRAGIPEERDLTAGLRVLASQMERSTGLVPRLTLEVGGMELSAQAVAHLLHIANEALSNISRHTQATAVSIELARADGELRLTIRDNGGGFDPRRRGRRAGDGLRNMRERARLLGGRISVDSRLGQGTAISVMIHA